MYDVALIETEPASMDPIVPARRTAVTRTARGKAAKRRRPRLEQEFPAIHRLPSSFLVEILRMSPGETEFAATHGLLQDGVRAQYI